MPIIASANESKSFTPAPEGVHQAVAVDVIDQGMKPNPFKPGTEQRKIDIAWQIDEVREDGKRFVVYKRYTLSLNEKATLRHDLESWRGRPFTDVELAGFDVESIIGANALINVQHKKNADGTRTYANVMTVTPLIKGMVKITPHGYARKTEDNIYGDSEPTDAPEPPPITDDDIPFAWMLPLILPALGILGTGVLA
jgi:hypothetical protein